MTSIFLCAFSGIASAQLTQTKDNPIVFGHLTMALVMGPDDVKVELGFKLDRGYMKTNLAGFGEFSVAYLTDPWGTYIELTEGLNRVQ